jgi:hypothetical protein
MKKDMSQALALTLRKENGHPSSILMCSMAPFTNRARPVLGIYPTHIELPKQLGPQAFPGLIAIHPSRHCQGSP